MTKSESRDQFYSLMDQVNSMIPGVVLQISRKGEILSVNSKILQFIRSSSFNPINKPFEELLDQILLPESKVIMQSSIFRVLNEIDKEATFCAALTSSTEEVSFDFKVSTFENIILVIGVPVAITAQDTHRMAQLKLSYQRLLDTGNTVIFRTDPNLSISNVSGNSEELFGCSVNQFLRGGEAFWCSLIMQKDLVRLKSRIEQVMRDPCEVLEELSIIHQARGVSKKVLVRMVPLFSSERELLGWEGLCFDITNTRAAEEEASSQRQRIEALYAVSRALQLNLDPAMVALKGLRALIQATDSSSGLVFFYDQQLDQLELAAAYGVSQTYINEVEKYINGPSLVRHAIAGRSGILLENIQEDSRAVVKVAKIENLKATIVSPLLFGDRVLGCVVIFRKEARLYTAADFELVGAAANQIAVATYQAELFANERKQADFFAALYRLSHELSRHLNSREISQQAFKILHSELSCKRMWLGVMNEQSTHLVGQAGYGPGIFTRLADIHIDLTQEPQSVLAKAIYTKETFVVPPSGIADLNGLNQLFDGKFLGSVALVPLVSLGQAVGLLVIEPSVGSGFFTSSRLSLLTSMANEIAVVLVANRFQTKLAEADKMRMAGLFASGVAHNFNNMLQAILGQAGLMELQLGPKSPLREATAIIKAAASKGAALIRQLLSFSLTDTRERTNIYISEFIQQSKDLYKTILGSSIDLEISLQDDEVSVMADRGQIQQVISNLLINAKESISSESGKVQVSSARVRLTSGEVDPELSPGEYIRIEIKDNGHGMDEQILSRCFEPFFTTKNVDSVTGIGISGSGLGLSTAYSIMKQHGGIITAQSVVGKGSTFTMYFPIIEESSLNQTSGFKSIKLKAVGDFAERGHE